MPPVKLARALARSPFDQDRTIASMTSYGLFLLLALLLSVGPVSAAEPLVSPQWVHENLEKPGVRFVDLQSPQGYERAHLPGAVSSQYGQWRMKQPGKGSMMPPVPYLEKLLSGLGINNQTHVVLTPLAINPSEIAVATRIYWTMKVLGHEKVSILDGGLIAYSRIKDARFSNKPVSAQPANYQANPDLSLAPDGEAVFKALKDGVRFVDYRSEGEYRGKDGGPGTIPGSRHLHYVDLVEAKQGGSFLKPDEIRALYASRDISWQGPEIAFCNSAHRASLSWFVQSEILGNKDVLLYDGSMSEWVRKDGYPVEKPTN